LKNQIKTTQNCLSSFKILPDLQWSKQKLIKKIISRSYLSSEKQKNAFLKQNDVRKSFWSQNQQLVEVDVLKKKKIKKTKSRIKKKKTPFFTNSLFLTPFLNSDFIYWQQK